MFQNGMQLRPVKFPRLLRAGHTLLTSVGVCCGAGVVISGLNAECLRVADGPLTTAPEHGGLHGKQPTSHAERVEC